jgi:serine protease DegQ
MSRRAGWKWFVPVVATTAAVSGCAAAPTQLDKVVPVSVTAEQATAVSAPTPDTDSAILAAARQYVFRVRNDSCLATGTAFAADGKLVTNRHVAAGATSVDLATWDGQDFTGQVSVHADDADLALLDGVPPDYVYGTLAATDPVKGTPVWVAGYPLGDQLTVTSGKILGQVSGAVFGLGSSVLQISDPIQHGNSGSPLLNSSGQIVGVVFAIDTQNHDGLAVPVSALTSLLTSGDGDSSPLPCAD